MCEQGVYKCAGGCVRRACVSRGYLSVWEGVCECVGGVM